MSRGSGGSPRHWGVAGARAPGEAAADTRRPGRAAPTAVAERRVAGVGGIRKVSPSTRRRRLPSALIQLEHTAVREDLAESNDMPRGTLGAPAGDKVP